MCVFSSYLKSTVHNSAFHFLFSLRLWGRMIPFWARLNLFAIFHQLYCLIELSTSLKGIWFKQRKRGFSAWPTCISTGEKRNRRLKNWRYTTNGLVINTIFVLHIHRCFSPHMPPTETLSLYVMFTFVLL